jgi:hypothetical protein
VGQSVGWMQSAHSPDRIYQSRFRFIARARRSSRPLQTKLEYGGLYVALTAYVFVMTFEMHEMLSVAVRGVSAAS